jgi:hypothetical protein
MPKKSFAFDDETTLWEETDILSPLTLAPPRVQLPRELCQIHVTMPMGEGNWHNCHSESTNLNTELQLFGLSEEK